MFGRKTSFIVSLAISLISFAVSAKMSVANGREANRCPLRQFGQFSARWSIRSSTTGTRRSHPTA